MSRVTFTSIAECKPSSLEYQLVRTVNGNLEFGLNLRSTTILSVVAPAVADTEFSINHDLGFVPNGYIVLSKDAYCDVIKGATTWTTSTISLKCNQPNINLVLVIL